MAKYSNGVYHTFKYGDTPRLVFSAEPLTLDVLTFNKVKLTWVSPIGNFTKFRIVRNQNGLPSSAEDGVIIYRTRSLDGASLQGKLPFNSFVDGQDNPTSIPLTPGANVYYRIFLYTSDNIWVVAAEATDVVPKDTDAMLKFLNTLPRVLVSKELSPTGTIPLKTDSNKSDFYNFNDALIFTYEQMLTQIDLLRPKYNFDSANYYTIPTEFFSVGLTPEYNIPTTNQRRLIRDAIHLYQTKGTKAGIQEYSEDLTNYPTTLSYSPNLLLSVQESTFYNGTGNWVATSGTLVASTDILPDTNPSNQIDIEYAGKFTASSSSGKIKLGFDNPILNGIPVQPNTQYTVSMKIKSPTSAGNVTLSVQPYDRTGATTGSLVSSTATAAVNAWGSVSKTFTTGSTDTYLGLQIGVSASGIYYFDQVCLQTGSSVAYDEARALTLTVYPSKTNYINNPSFNVDFTGWSYTGMNTPTRDSTNISPFDFAGAYSGKFVTTGAWTLANSSHIPAQPGTYLVASAYVQSADMTNMTMYMDFYDSGDNLVSTVQSDPTVSVLSSDWSRFYVRGLVNVNTSVSYAKIRFSGNTSGTFYLDMAQAEVGYNPSDYIDGDMPAYFGVVWAGTANNSASYQYPDKDTRLLRLAQTLPEWVPYNAFWRVNTLVETAFTNATTPAP